MKSTFVTVLLGVLLAVAVAGTACGNDDGAPMEEQSIAVVDDQHTTATDGHNHDHDALTEVTYEPVPTIQIRTHLDPISGVNLEVVTTDFTLAPERVSTAPIDGEGHMHVYVDGVKLMRLYGHWAHLDLTEPGDYEIRVELSANDHSALAVNGRKIDATTVVTIPGPSSDPGDSADAEDHDEMPEGSSTDDSHDHDHGEMSEGSATAINLVLEGGRPAGGVKRHRVNAGDSVTLFVSGDTTDELHIHGYDLLVRFSPQQSGSITFDANIPGVFEVETHSNSDLVMELEVR